MRELRRLGRVVATDVIVCWCEKEKDREFNKAVAVLGVDAKSSDPKEVVCDGSFVLAFDLAFDLALALALALDLSSAAPP